MPTVLPPSRSDISNTPSPSNAVAKAGLGKLWDYVTNLLGTAGTQAGALTALGAAKSGANIDITSLTGLTGPINEAHGADIASAATINLTTATGNLVDVTGTVAITAITLADGAQRTVRFPGILTLTNGASLVLPGAANITTAAGDFAVFRGYAAGVVRCIGYTRADGTAIIGTVDASTSVKGKVQLATSAEAVTGTDALKAITPATMKAGLNASGTAPIYAARAFVNFNGTGTVAINNSGNVSSITDNGVGDYTANFTTAMPAATYTIVGTAGDVGALANVFVSAPSAVPTTSACRFVVKAFDNTAADRAYVNIAVTI